MYRIFIVEDDEIIANLLKKNLCSWGYDVSCAEDFSNISTQVQQFDPHLILLDIILPFYNGFHWCSEIRRFSKAPIMFLSSAADNMNIVMAMHMGGDDFIAKPFDLDVLTAKIHALLRRSYSFQGAVNLLEHAGLSLNLGDATLSYGISRTELTRNEFRIMQLFLEHPGEILSRERIMQALWDDDTFIDDNTLTVNMTRLRKKLEALGLQGAVKTRKGIGYQLL